MKTNTRELVLESLFVNGKEVLHYDFVDETKNFIKIPGAKNLRTKGLRNQLSVIKYIYNNTIVDEDSVINQLLKFVGGMLYFRSLREANQYIGYKLGGEKLDDIILLIITESKVLRFCNLTAPLCRLIERRVMPNGCRISWRFW